MKRARLWGAGAVLPFLVFAACQVSQPTAGSTIQPASGAPTPQTLQLNVTSVDTTFTTRDHFIASVEMQISGEPFAESMGGA